MVAFLAYSSVPFLEPVRRSIDFFFTKTLLTREEFVLIESIFDLVFKVKCERVNEYKYMTNRRLRTGLKTVVGLFAILAMLMFIAAPLIYYTLEDSLTQHNHIKYLSLDLSSPVLGNMYHQRVSTFHHISYRKFQLMKNHYGKNRAAYTFLNEFTHDDIMVAELPAISLTEWSTAMPRSEVAKILRNMTMLRPTIKWVVERVVEGDEDFNDHTTMLKAPPPNSTLPNLIGKLAEMVEKGGTAKPVLLPDILTKFLHFHRTDPSSNIKSLMLTRARDPTVDDLLVQLVRVEGSDKFAWKLSENCDTDEYRQHLSKLPFAKDCETLDIFLFSAHPPLFGVVKNFGGLIGMYAGVILSLWTYLAKIWKRDAYEMMFEEMVSPDKILQLCLDIYQCRITQQAEMELDLGQKLINIFTSSTEFDKWSKGAYGIDPRALNYP
ncbi:piezo-type mechanosensitive ion channel component 1-like [Neocloeon triangulifer]|uniref:piezo-type mechanosensitive ion channel component 1-like n=1 Tax=Neocloeon triangulifer TaxID=2078957 RepID=UPI00286EE837|nr:piezo-type mechanosensitive ion channel component 1-like [Neocloeon triangulifer]